MGTDPASAAPSRPRPGNGRAGRRRRRGERPRGAVAAAAGLADPRRRGHLCLERPIAGIALPHGDLAAERASGRPSSATLRDRAHGACHHEVPAFAVIRLFGEVLGTFRECDDLRGGASGASRAERTAFAATARKRAFFPIESTSPTRSTGIAAASGNPGKPPPLPRSSTLRGPAAASGWTQIRLSRTWLRAICSGRAERSG